MSSSAAEAQGYAHPPQAIPRLRLIKTPENKQTRGRYWSPFSASETDRTTPGTPGVLSDFAIENDLNAIRDRDLRANVAGVGVDVLPDQALSLQQWQRTEQALAHVSICAIWSADDERVAEIVGRRSSWDIASGDFTNVETSLRYGEIDTDAPAWMLATIKGAKDNVKSEESKWLKELFP